MKKLLSCVLQSGVLAASLVSGGRLFAQEAGSPPETSAPPPTPGHGGGHRGMMGDPDQQLARMTMRYNLSADQQAQIKPILVSTQQQMQAMHGDTSLSRDDRMAKMQSIRGDSKTKIEAILNDEQKKQFEQDQREMMDRMQQRGQGGGPGGGAPPPPPQ